MSGDTGGTRENGPNLSADLETVGASRTTSPPAYPRPTEAAYRYALELVRYEGGDLASASPTTQDTIRRWRAWQAYDAAVAAGRDRARPRPTLAPQPAEPSRSGPDVAVTLPHGPLPDPDWVLLVDELLPYLYRNWRPIRVAQAGHPRRGVPHVVNADGIRISTLVALWAEHHGHRYGWARRLLEKAEEAGLVLRETHLIAASSGGAARSWSQWVLLEPEAYRRRLAEVLTEREGP